MKSALKSRSKSPKETGLRRNTGLFSRFLLFMLAIIVLYSLFFHLIMLFEGRTFSWLTGLYWTLTVMSTLGLGDITFQSDLGKLFSIIVLLTGIICLLAVLPVVFIQFIYTPWEKAQRQKLIPRSLPVHVKGQILIVGDSPIGPSLAEDLEAYAYTTVFITKDDQQTLSMLDRGFQAMQGSYNSPETYAQARLKNAAMLLVMGNDIYNTNAIFAARRICPDIPIYSRVEHDEASDILLLAGATRVFQFRKLLGQDLAQRVIAGSNRIGIMARYGRLQIGEVAVMGTDLAGKSLLDSHLRQNYGLNVVGIRERENFSLPSADSLLSEQSVLVVAGSPEQFAAFNADLAPEQRPNSPVIILGGGRVGKAAALALHEQGTPLVVVDKVQTSNWPSGLQTIKGDASELEILTRAGIQTATSVIVTTHDDDTNIYLTLYCRKLRPDIQIVSRATLGRNLNSLHAAGANQVLSLSSLVSSQILNLLSPGRIFPLNEDLHLFRVKADAKLAGKTVLSSQIRAKTCCTVVGIERSGADMLLNPPPDFEFALGDEIYMIGNSAAEADFYQAFQANRTKAFCNSDAPSGV